MKLLSTKVDSTSKLELVLPEKLATLPPVPVSVCPSTRPNSAREPPPKDVIESLESSPVSVEMISRNPAAVTEALALILLAVK